MTHIYQLLMLIVLPHLPHQVAFPHLPVLPVQVFQVLPPPHLFPPHLRLPLPLLCRLLPVRQVLLALSRLHFHHLPVRKVLARLRLVQVRQVRFPRQVHHHHFHRAVRLLRFLVPAVLLLSVLLPLAVFLAVHARCLRLVLAFPVPRQVQTLTGFGQMRVKRQRQLG